MHKKIIALLSACAVLLMTSCSSKNNSSQDSTQSKASDLTQAQTAQPGDSAAAGTDELQIASDRVNKDYDSLKDISDKLFKQYYNGIKDEDYDECFGIFPDFYRKAIEDESKEYGQTNDDYIKQINDQIKKQYGDDYYSYAEITGILQLYDDSLTQTEDTINKTFGTNVKLEDAYTVYYNQIARGSADKGTEKLVYILLKIDGKYYMYDNYFEKQDENAQNQ